MNRKWLNLQGKVALVTGASKGLGRGYAKSLAEAGAMVICLARNAAMLQETVSQIKGIGGKAEVCQADISKVSEIKEVVDNVVNKYGSLDILVNNAGTEIAKPFLDVTTQDYDVIMGTNLKGVYFTAQAAASHMVSQRRGKIINIGSLGSQIGLAGSTVYCASKGGVLQFTRALAVELASYNIQVNALGPGYFCTDMTEPFFKDPKHKAWIENRIPLGRIGTPEDLASIMVFLASAGSDYITGQIFYVDGGWLAS